jgi:hypothetical protein
VMFCPVAIWVVWVALLAAVVKGQREHEVP